MAATASSTDALIKAASASVLTHPANSSVSRSAVRSYSSRSVSTAPISVARATRSAPSTARPWACAVPNCSPRSTAARSLCSAASRCNSSASAASAPSSEVLPEPTSTKRSCRVGDSSSRRAARPCTSPARTTRPGFQDFATLSRWSATSRMFCLTTSSARRWICLCDSAAPRGLCTLPLANERA